MAPTLRLVHGPSPCTIGTTGHAIAGRTVGSLGSRPARKTMPPDDTPELREVLRRYRVAARLTQEELAERAGLSVRGLSDLERGARTRPRPHTVRQLATALAL